MTGQIWGFDKSNNTITIKCDEDITGIEIGKKITVSQDEDLLGALKDREETRRIFRKS